MKNVFKLVSVLIITLAFASCSNDESSNSATEGKAVLKAKTTFTSGAKISSRAGTIVLNSFKVNLKEIEFELDDDNQSDDDGFFDGDDDIKLNGPFELSLLNSPAAITLVDIPNGKYEEVEFKMDKNENSSSPMYNKSIEIKGTINGVPFVYWDDEDEEFEVDYEETNKDITVTGNTIEIVFDFDLNSVLSSVDLSQAKDGDGDGVIEIGPSDDDGNSSIADMLDDKLEEFTELDD